MLDLRFLDVGLGVALLFLLVSLIVTTIQEGIASLFKLRSSNLHTAVTRLLRDPDLGRRLYEHPLILGPYDVPKEGALTLNRWRRPSYIPSQTFVIALLDTLNTKNRKAIGSGVTDLLVSARQLVATIEQPQLKVALSILVDDVDALGSDAQTRARAVSERLELWFNHAMGRASGWYKRKAQLLSMVLGFALAAAVNADAGHVAQRLWSDSSLRASVVAAAEAVKATPPAGSTTDSFGSQLAKGLDNLQQSKLPVGWEGRADAPLGWMFLGWLVTALAASLGAPFWFDVLGKALQIRGSGQRIGVTERSRAPTGRAAEERTPAPERSAAPERAPASKRPAPIT